MKSLIKLIVMLCLLSALIAGYIVYNNYSKDDNTETPDIEENESFDVHVLAGEIITSIEYTLEDEKVSLEISDNKWIWSEDKDYPLDESYVEYMIESLSKITANRLVAEDLKNQNDYGMDKPTIEIKFLTSLGNEYVYTLGAYNSIIEGYYFKFSAQDKIYLTEKNILEDFGYGILEMAETENTPSTKAEYISEVEYIIDGKSHIVTTDSSGADFYTNAYKYFTFDEDGKKIAVNGQIGAEFMSAVAGIKAGSVKGYKLDEQTLSEYGLGENKRYVIKVKYKEPIKTENGNADTTETKEGSYTIYIGKTTGEDSKEIFYSMFDNSDLLYSVSSADTFFKTIESDFESKLVCPVLADDNNHFKVEIGDKVYSYSMEDVEKDDKLIDIYNSITSLVKTGNTDAMEGKLLLKVTFTLENEELVLNVYEYSDENYIAVFDNSEKMLVSAESVNSILESF